ncbi:50S ribosomal protein L18 [Candidatus Woesebacteria bacterium]|nr:50S ribosomal protein L18 [Candidatus Woesebacteria bacterium]MCD8507629.1 50S ribosomal protein L18 [Candidatus Woesebacteria bacterium]MCD8526785.1 50S ribosomal protein L18 [Candidatus Woesebacteria bacterium]MCD8546469.1 50S ribosomal protein L18 [Candidatus Woesebacteria bacterium]
MTRNQQKALQKQRLRRARRVRSKLHGTAERPRLSIYRSNQHVFIQAIDDDKSLTVASAYDKGAKGTKTERAQAAAEQVAEQLKQAGVKQVTFDRGYYRYHGRVKAVADTIREQGIEL